MRKILFSLLACCAALSAWAQSPLCDGSRFLTPVFSNVATTLDVVYGANTTSSGQNMTLMLDIYEPQGDVATARPLIVLAHGGSFYAGTRKDADVVKFCNDLAKHGYVAVSIEYRLGFNFGSLDSIEMTKAVLRAVHDMRAAVRFMRKEATTYRIDTDQIYAGGVSAGALTALHHAYLDDINEAPTYVANIINNFGGMEGTSGNAGFSSEVKGVVNINGALSEKEWLKAGEEPLVSIHGTNDNVVPYGTAVITVFSITPIKVVDGSGAIHPYAQSIGINSTLKTLNGQGHVPHASSQAYYDTTFWYVRDFLYAQTCNSIISVQPAAQAFFKAYPNPTENTFTLELQATMATVRVLDLQGKCVYQAAIQAGKNDISVNHWAKGMYLLQVQTDKSYYTEKLVVQ
ncbi:MAG: T9SS type A sorting domain-containing protein [Bacteroidia bacterium]